MRIRHISRSPLSTIDSQSYEMFVVCGFNHNNNKKKKQLPTINSIEGNSNPLSSFTYIFFFVIEYKSRGFTLVQNCAAAAAVAASHKFV